MNARINGRLGDADTIMVRPGNREFELLTPADYAIYGIVIKRDCLVATASQMGCRIDWAQLERAEVLHVAESARLACQQTLARLILQDRADSEGQPVASVACAEQAVMLAVLSMLDASEVDSAVSNSFHATPAHRCAGARLCAWASGSARRPCRNCANACMSAAEPCNTVSRTCWPSVRSSICGIIRLNGARRELRRALFGFPDGARCCGGLGFLAFQPVLQRLPQTVWPEPVGVAATAHALNPRDRRPSHG